MPETSTRDRRAIATRDRIADVALDLFVRHGYSDTTIDEIAAAAGVGRRTVFHHFPTKSAMLFHHLRGRRDEALQLLRERPPAEPPLVSLHAVLRELCTHRFDRALLRQIRTVLDLEPRLISADMSPRTDDFENALLAVLEERAGGTHSAFELRVMTRMATSWVTTAAHFHATEGRQSLVKYFDDAVATCARELPGIFG